jgi:O-methyltransferase
VRALLRRSVRRLLERRDYAIGPPREWPSDFEAADIALVEAASPYTMTTPAALVALADAVRHLVAAGVEGAIVESGVWRGGSMMAVARTLMDEGHDDVDLYLFDTFEGMPAPSGRDVRWSGESAHDLLARDLDVDTSKLWARAGLEDVQRVMALTGYPASRVHYVKGRVQDTMPEHAPDRIALLRLDTDWYESTCHELTHLYPRLSPGGILIIDDYGWWRGQREATDEYFRDHPPRPFLVRVDDGGVRIAVKLGGRATAP